MIRNEILNIYVFEFFENSLNKYFINDDKMKLINVNEKFLKIDVCLVTKENLQT